MHRFKGGAAPDVSSRPMGTRSDSRTALDANSSHSAREVVLADRNTSRRESDINGNGNSQKNRVEHDGPYSRSIRGAAELPNEDVRLARQQTDPSHGEESRIMMPGVNGAAQHSRSRGKPHVDNPGAQGPGSVRERQHGVQSAIRMGQDRNPRVDTLDERKPRGSNRTHLQDRGYQALVYGAADLSSNGDAGQNGEHRKAPHQRHESSDRRGRQAGESYPSDSGSGNGQDVRSGGSRYVSEAEPTHAVRGGSMASVRDKDRNRDNPRTRRDLESPQLSDRSGTSLQGRGERGWTGRDDRGGTGRGERGWMAQDERGGTGRDNSGGTGRDDRGGTGRYERGGTGRDERGWTGRDERGAGRDNRGGTGRDVRGGTGRDERGWTGRDERAGAGGSGSGNQHRRRDERSQGSSRAQREADSAEGYDSPGSEFSAHRRGDYSGRGPSAEGRSRRQ